ncbi:MAG: hypothetical protein WKF81_13700, partial [Thermomicrobiales bacterium]
DQATVVGADPLLPFGPNAAWHLRRTDSFSNAPDNLVMCGVDATGSVSAFEELVGSHGGLGGSQTQPILVHPTELATGQEPIVGTAALQQVLRRWVPS